MGKRLVARAAGIVLATAVGGVLAQPVAAQDPELLVGEVNCAEFMGTARPDSAAKRACENVGPDFLLSVPLEALENTGEGFIYGRLWEPFVDCETNHTFVGVLRRSNSANIESAFGGMVVPIPEHTVILVLELDVPLVDGENTLFVRRRISGDTQWSADIQPPCVEGPTSSTTTSSTTSIPTTPDDSTTTTTSTRSTGSTTSNSTTTTSPLPDPGPPAVQAESGFGWVQIGVIAGVIGAIATVAGAVVAWRERRDRLSGAAPTAAGASQDPKSTGQSNDQAP